MCRQSIGNASRAAQLCCPVRGAFPSNPVWFTVGGAPIRDRAAADYSLGWIERLTAMADESPGWRSEDERRAIFDQFQQVAAVYERLEAEAGGVSR